MFENNKIIYISLFGAELQLLPEWKLYMSLGLVADIIKCIIPLPPQYYNIT